MAKKSIIVALSPACSLQCSRLNATLAEVAASPTLRTQQHLLQEEPLCHSGYPQLGLTPDTADY
jgi:hypothetical protein